MKTAPCINHATCRPRQIGSRRSICMSALIVLWLTAAAFAATTTSSSSAEEKTSRAFESARKGGPLTLRAFLLRMPKGADLHNHLSGAIYAESWIRAAAEDGLCVNITSMSFEKSALGDTHAPACGSGTIAASALPSNSALYDGLVDAFSMRSFVASAGVSAHDHFFASFARFGGTAPTHGGEWLDEVASRASGQNEQYLELMETPTFQRTTTLARDLEWDPDLEKLRNRLLSGGLREDVAVARQHVQQALDGRNAREKCGTAEAAPACKVEIRFLYQVLRGFAPQQVFAQTVLAFEVASADPHFVGLNFVMPEDGYRSMNDYRLQMHMLDYLHSVYPKVHISLHAGELAPGLVPPEGLTFHIRAAMEQGHAERIGHGTDVLYEDRPYELLEQMAKRHVLVEINLTSNDLILGVKGDNHPLPIYLRYNVPVALSTDDEGVSRIDLTHEYVSAAMTYPLTYRELKKMARASIEHCFLSGPSLWKVQDVYSQTVQMCATQRLGGTSPSARCSAFLQSSEKARQQWELERRFTRFEAAE